jgi:hypothetical protein
MMAHSAITSESLCFELFRDVGHECFGVGAGERLKRPVSRRVWFGGQFDVVVDGAFGGFVEFLGFQRFN